MASEVPKVEWKFLENRIRSQPGICIKYCKKELKYIFSFVSSEEIDALRGRFFARKSWKSRDHLRFESKGTVGLNIPDHTMRTNLPKLLDLFIFCTYSLNFSLEFFIMIFFVTNQLNSSKFLPPQIRKTLISY